MPCRGPDLTYDDVRHSLEKDFLHNSTLAETFCELCRHLENRKFDIKAISPKAYIWWMEHKKRDAERVAKELAELQKAKDTEAALEKLSEYEKSLLGVRK